MISPALASYLGIYLRVAFGGGCVVVIVSDCEGQGWIEWETGCWLIGVGVGKGERARVDI